VAERQRGGGKVREKERDCGFGKGRVVDERERKRTCEREKGREKENVCV